MFALPNPDHPDWFYSVVSTTKCVLFSDKRSSAELKHSLTVIVDDRLTADILETRGWFGLTSESKHNFTADITATELVVNKSYTYTS